MQCPRCTNLLIPDFDPEMGHHYKCLCCGYRPLIYTPSPEALNDTRPGPEPRRKNGELAALVVEALRERPGTRQELARRLKTPVRQISWTLCDLKSKGAVERSPIVDAHGRRNVGGLWRAVM